MPAGDRAGEWLGGGSDRDPTNSKRVHVDLLKCNRIHGIVRHPSGLIVGVKDRSNYSGALRESGGKGNCCARIGNGI